MSRLRLDGKVVIVTGAGRSSTEILGTGAAIARLFADEGALVGILDKDERAALRTQETIEASGHDSVIAIGDIRHSSDCERMVSEVVDSLGPLDGLVNNAGITGRGGVVEIEEDVWYRVIDTNLNGAMLMSRFSIPRMIESGGGFIVNISSIGGSRALGSSSYAAAKAGLQQLTRDMALSYGRSGVRVNCIQPGHIYSPMAGDGHLTEDGRRLRRRMTMLDTEGTAEDVARAALFLASDESRWITAVTLPVDAGSVECTGLSMYRFMPDGGETSTD